MKAAFPYMGNIHIPIAGLFRALGIEPIVPPPPSKESVSQGVLLAPEQMCIPFKYTLGNMAKALEMGADTLVFASGSWSCRFGYYARLEPDILRDLGYEFQTLALRKDDIPAIFREIFILSNRNPLRMLPRVTRAAELFWRKSLLVDRVEILSRRYRPLEFEPGAASRAVKSCLARIDATESVTGLRNLGPEIAGAFGKIRVVPDRQPLRIKVVGESFCLLEPVANFNVLERLGGMGAWADPFLTTHHWLGFHALKIGERKRQMLLKPARRYWRYNTGGEDENAVAYMLEAARLGYDGVLHLHPFGCMPGTVVGPVLSQISREHDLPLLDISLDEHTSEAGFLTRLEAFISVLQKRRRRASSRVLRSSALQG